MFALCILRSPPPAPGNPSPPALAGPKPEGSTKQPKPRTIPQEGRPFFKGRGGRGDSSICMHSYIHTLYANYMYVVAVTHAVNRVQRVDCIIWLSSFRQCRLDNNSRFGWTLTIHVNASVCTTLLEDRAWTPTHDVEIARSRQVLAAKASTDSKHT